MGSSVFTKHGPGSTFGGLKVLNLGCGHAKFAARNVVNIDAFGDPDVKWNLNKTPLPFEDNHFDLILANHILEHVENWWPLFEDCARILKHNGRMEVYVPGDGSDSVLGYRDHLNVINWCSFYGVYGTYRASTNAWASEHAESAANWMKPVNRIDYLKDVWWLKWWLWPHWYKEWCRIHLRNVIVEQGFFFRKVTPEELAEERLRCADRFAAAVPKVAQAAERLA